jgi:hypothetical protein
MNYLANTYNWMWGAQREPTPSANSTILTHVLNDQCFSKM